MCFVKWLLHIWANTIQHIATYRNRVAKLVQHCVPNNFARCRLEMLRPFGLTWCDLMVGRCDRRQGVNTISKYHTNTNRICKNIFAFDSFYHLTLSSQNFDRHFTWTQCFSVDGKVPSLPDGKYSLPDQEHIRRWLRILRIQFHEVPSWSWSCWWW